MYDDEREFINCLRARVEKLFSIIVYIEFLAVTFIILYFYKNCIFHTETHDCLNLEKAAIIFILNFIFILILGCCRYDIVGFCVRHKEKERKRIEIEELEMQVKKIELKGILRKDYSGNNHNQDRTINYIAGAAPPIIIKQKDHTGDSNGIGFKYSSVDSGGYATIDISEEKKSVFCDLLRGFEDYAAIKGYKVSISIDDSETGKISFKITVHEFGITGSRKTIKKDLDEYIEKIKNGDFDSLSEVLEPIEHAKLVMALKNRIVFLQQN